MHFLVSALARSPGNENRTQIIIDSDDGILYIAEIGQQKELGGGQAWL